MRRYPAAQAGAVNGKLTIMCGGSEKAYARAEPVMAAYARQMRLLGPSGAGQLTKMVNQICIAGVVQGLAEGFSLARATGLDIEAVVEVISKGAAQSWQMENRHKTMAAGHYDHGFAVEWMRKDLGICLEEARRAGVSLPWRRWWINFTRKWKVWAASAGTRPAFSPARNSYGPRGRGEVSHE